MSRNGSDRLGLRRAARARLAAARGHAGAPGRPGHPPRHVRPAPRGAARPRERPGVAAAARTSRDEPGAVLDLRLAAQRVRRAGASSTATRSSAPTRSCCGRPSSATSPTAPRPCIDEFISVGRAEVGPALERRAAAAPRLRGPGARPLVGAHRALPAALRRGQHDRRAAVDARRRTSTCCAARRTRARAARSSSSRRRRCCACAARRARWRTSRAAGSSR